jgi:hypothetical protein
MKNKLSINKLTLASALLGLLMFGVNMAFADDCSIFLTQGECTPVGCTWNGSVGECHLNTPNPYGGLNQIDCEDSEGVWNVDHCELPASSFCTVYGTSYEDCLPHTIEGGLNHNSCHWAETTPPYCSGTYTPAPISYMPTISSGDVSSISGDMTTTFGQLKTFLVNGAGLWLTLGGALVLIYMLRRWLSMKKTTYRNRL